MCFGEDVCRELRSRRLGVGMLGVAIVGGVVFVLGDGVSGVLRGSGGGGDVGVGVV